jgi:hypothetical protein
MCSPLTRYRSSAALTKRPFTRVLISARALRDSYRIVFSNLQQRSRISLCNSRLPNCAAVAPPPWNTAAASHRGRESPGRPHPQRHNQGRSTLWLIVQRNTPRKDRDRGMQVRRESVQIRSSKSGQQSSGLGWPPGPVPGGLRVTFGSSSSPYSAARRCRGAALRIMGARCPQRPEQGSAGRGPPEELHRQGGGERVSREQPGGETAAARPRKQSRGSTGRGGAGGAAASWGSVRHGAPRRASKERARCPNVRCPVKEGPSLPEP